jgi:hypothetical protein
MSSKPTRRKDVLDSIINLKKRQREINGLNRQNFSGLGSSAFGAVSGTGSSGSSSSGNSGNNDSELKIKTAGDTMIGPLAFYYQSKYIASGTLDISEETGAYSSRVVVTGQGGAADDLEVILGAAFAGQILFFQPIQAVTLQSFLKTAAAWASGTSYSIGDVVLYNSQRYTCYVAHTSSGSILPTDTTKWYRNNIRITGSTEQVVAVDEIILLQYDSTDGVWTVVSGGGSGSSGAGLADNNTWTGTNQFTGSYVTVTGSFSATGSSITLGNASTDIINFGGKAGSDLNMGTYDITNLDNISFGTGTQNIADTTTPVNNLFVKTVRLQSGSLITNKPSITSSGGNSFDLNFPTGSNFTIHEQSQAKHIFSGSSLTTPNILSSGTWTLTSDTNSPNTNGMFARVGGHVKVYTGGALKSLSDIGTGSGGASLSGNNTWTGTNSFNGTYVTVAGTFSATGGAFTIGDASSDQLYINSTMQSDLDMGDNDLTDVQSVRFGAVSWSGVGGAIWYDGTNLKGKASTGNSFTIDGSGGGSGAGLGDNNTWTGTNTFNGSYVTVTGTFSATGAAISLGNHSSDTVNIGGTLGGTLRMGDNDIDDIDNLNVDGTANLNNIVNLGSGSSDDINLKGKLDVINHTTSSTGPFSNIYYTGYIEIKVGSSTKRLYYGNG